jgi:glycosyltransferase involved in cell wall biosynthesis
LLLAEGPDRFVDATIALFENPPRAEALARNARQALEEKWDWNVVIPRLEKSYREALARCRV